MPQPQPPSLPELQRAFAAAIVEGDAPRLEPWIVARGIEPAARLRIYRNAVFAIQVEALITDFPAVCALLGEVCFDGLATRYAARHGSRSGNLQEFGADFAAFLGEQPEVAAYLWIGDVAALEWARQQCALAASLPRADADALIAAVVAGTDAPLPLQPHVHVVSSEVPVLDLWHCAMQTVHALADPASAAQHVLLWRDAGEVQMRGIAAAQAAFARTLRDGGTLENALQSALTRDAGVSPEFLLRPLIEHALIAMPEHLSPVKDGHE